MFWDKGYAPSQNIEALLEKENATVEEFLDDDDILQECKAQRKAIINYFTRPEVIKRLVEFITTEPPEDLPFMVRFRHANMACEILTLGLPSLDEKLLSDAETLKTLYSYLESEPPLNPLLSSFFTKTFHMLFTKKAEQDWFLYQQMCLQLLEYIKSQNNFLDLVCKHFTTPIIPDLIMQMMRDIEGGQLKRNLYKWLTEDKLVQRLIAILGNPEESDKHANVAEFFCDLIQQGRSMRHTDQENDSFEPAFFGSNPILKSIESEETIEALLNVILEPNAQESAIVSGISVVLTLIKPVVFADEPNSDRLKFLHNREKENHEVILTTVIRVIVPRLSDFYYLMLNPPKRPDIINTAATLSPPFGNTRLHICRLFTVLLQTRHEEASKAICETGFFGSLLTLFKEYCWNNFLHSEVEKCFQMVFYLESSNNNNSTQGSTIVNDGSCSNPSNGSNNDDHNPSLYDCIFKHAGGSIIETEAEAESEVDASNVDHNMDTTETIDKQQESSAPSETHDPELQTDPERELEEEPESQSKPQPLEEPKLETEPQPVLEAKLEAEAQPPEEPKLEVEPQPPEEPRLELEPQPPLDSKLEGEPQPLLEAKLEVEPHPLLEPKLEPESKPESDLQLEQDLNKEDSNKENIPNEENTSKENITTQNEENQEKECQRKDETMQEGENSDNDSTKIPTDYGPSALQVHVIAHCKAVSKLIDCWQHNTVTAKVERGRRLGYMGHLIKIFKHISNSISESEHIGALIENNLSDASEFQLWHKIINSNDGDLKTALAVQNRMLANCNAYDACDITRNLPKDFLTENSTWDYIMSNNLGFNESNTNDIVFALEHEMYRSDPLDNDENADLFQFGRNIDDDEDDDDENEDGHGLFHKPSTVNSLQIFGMGGNPWDPFSNMTSNSNASPWTNESNFDNFADFDSHFTTFSNELGESLTDMANDLSGGHGDSDSLKESTEMLSTFKTARAFKEEYDNNANVEKLSPGVGETLDKQNVEDKETDNVERVLSSLVKNLNTVMQDSDDDDDDEGMWTKPLGEKPTNFRLKPVESHVQNTQNGPNRQLDLKDNDADAHDLEMTISRTPAYENKMDDTPADEDEEHASLRPTPSKQFAVNETVEPETAPTS